MIWGLLLLLTILANRAVDRLLVARAMEGLDRALGTCMAAEARWRYEDIAQAMGPRWTATQASRIKLANVLSLERNYTALEDVMTSVPMAALQPTDRSAFLSNLAVARMEMGDPAEGVALAKQALECAPAGTPSAELAITKMALAQGYLALGRPAEALPLLEDAVATVGAAEGCSPLVAANRARASLLLGDVLAVLGRTADATESYERAVSAAPRGRSATMARARLDSLTPFRGS